MTIVTELLTAARDLVATGTCRGALARDKDGNPTDPASEEAVEFSIYGALQRAAFDKRDSTGIDTALVRLQGAARQDPMLTRLNASETDDVLARFDEAIAASEGAEDPSWKDNFPEAKAQEPSNAVALGQLFPQAVRADYEMSHDLKAARSRKRVLDVKASEGGLEKHGEAEDDADSEVAKDAPQGQDPKQE